MQIDLLTEPSCFLSLAEEWTALLDRSVTAPIFVTPAFVQSWWQTYGKGTLQIVTVRDGQRLVGVAPLYEYDGVLSFLGNKEVSDYLDVIVDHDASSSVLPELWSFIQEKMNWREISLISLPQSSALLAFVSEHVPTLKKTQQDVCPVIELPTSWDEYLSMVGKKQRHEIKRKWKNLVEQTQPEFLVIDQVEQLQKYLPEFIRLHQLSSQEKAAFWTEDQLKYFELCATAAAEQGWLKLFFVQVKEKLAAVMLGFSYCGQFLLYNSGYDPIQFAGLSPGIVLTAFTIQSAIESGLKRYDFLRGDEEYKFRFRAVAEPVWDLSAIRE